MRLLFYILRPIYYLLYHQFAWTYDFVAAVISLGCWQNWVQVVLPYLNGRVLEIGFGPGHLQLSLNEKQVSVFGLDESRQMTHQASRRLRKQGFTPRLSRGYAQNIPFADGVFDSVVATFPADFIFDLHTLKEIQRVLVPAGMLVILPLAWITGPRPLERLAAWLFRVSGEAPDKPGLSSATIKNRFARTQYEVQTNIVELKGSQVLVVVAEKKP
jgi:ubiquinone/menaquinone biosynthesis C-methylase UbiE